VFSPKKPILWLIIILLALAGFLAVRIWFYTTTVQITANEPFQVNFRSENEIRGTDYECLETSCSYSLLPNDYLVKITAPQFEPWEAKVALQWLKKNEITADLKKIPLLVPLTEKPLQWTEKEQKEDLLRKEFSFTSDGKLLQTQDGVEKFVVEFPVAETLEMKIFPIYDSLFLLTPEKIYIVNVPEKRKYLIYSASAGEKVRDLLPITPELFLAEKIVGSSAQVLLFSVEDRKDTEFPEQIPLKFICHNPENAQEFFFLTPEENSWLLKKWNSANGEIAGIAAQDFSEAPQAIFCESSTAVVIASGEKFFRFAF